MISIVLVSHSQKIAEGLLDLLRQVTPAGVQVAQAAGVGSGYTEIGTDAVHIAEVIQSVFSPDGVLVFMDLGSAVLSTEMALDLLPEEMRGKICLCPAPFVEGALAAGVQAGLGGDLQSICQESQKAIGAKIAQLSSTATNPPEQGVASSVLSQSGGSGIIISIGNLHGLHLRPAAQFVEAASRFQADINVWNITSKRGPATARSINSLAMLNVRQGDNMKISASGPQAEEAVRALGELIRKNFGEEGSETASPVEGGGSSSASQALPPDEAGPGLIGIPISTGVAIAPLFRLKRVMVAAEPGRKESPDTEWKQFERVLQRVKGYLQERQAVLQQRLGSEKSAIFGALRLLLEDPELIQRVRIHIFQDNLPAATAWMKEIRQLTKQYRELADPLMKQRAADIEDIGSQVLAGLAGEEHQLDIPGSDPVILFAGELTPTETSQLDLSQVAGLVTTHGAATSHSAILARALGIPAVSGIDLSHNSIPSGILVIVDGGQGLVIVDPSEEIRTRYEARKRSWAAEKKTLQATSREPALLKNGRRIEVLANIGSLEEARPAVLQGADGVGLLRSEFLYLSRSQAPSEEEQVTALRSIGQAMDRRPVDIRTLDVGGDKDLPYLSAPEEANPFLGVRAIRLALRNPNLFQAQLRAILRAAGEYPFRVMFPMIANLEDLHQAFGQLEIAHASLSREKKPHRWPIETGIMVEIPSAALISDRLAPLIDFFSIGTNDLTQYTLAADRGNPSLADYHDALHPAVLSLVQHVVRSARRFGKRVGICGEIAGDPQAAPVLVGLGLDELSMNPAAIPRIKETIRGLDEQSARRLAENALQMDSAAVVRAEAQKYLSRVSNEQSISR